MILLLQTNKTNFQTLAHSKISSHLRHCDK